MAPLDEWIALPLREVTKSELREWGVPADLIPAVRSAAVLDDLDAIAIQPELLNRLKMTFSQRAACSRHRAFNSDHVADLRLELVDILVSLDDSQQATVDKIIGGGATRIRGVAGSGKTQVLLHAIAKRLYGRSAAADLFWSYNRALADMAHVVVHKLAGNRAQHLALDTFDGWCKKYVGESRPIRDSRHEDIRRLANEARDRARRATWDAESKLWTRGPEFWIAEFNFIRDHPIETLSDYLEVERVGRGTRLDRAHRALVWVALEKFKALLDENHLRDWRQVRLDAYHRLRETKSSRHDQVFIDEAQDLPPLALRIASLLSGPNITLALDGSQAIYRKGFRWKDMGLEHSRSVTLTTCYRSTAAISRIVEPFRSAEDDPLSSTNVRPGVKPRVVNVSGGAYEADWVADDIGRRLARGETPGHLAVLSYTRRLAFAVFKRLEERGIQVSSSTEGPLDFSDETVKVVTMNSAKGLEFPVVYIAPLWDGDFFPRDRGEGPDELKLETERLRKVLYVAMTRAREELILVHRKGKAARILAEIPADAVDQEVAVAGA